MARQFSINREFFVHTAVDYNVLYGDLYVPYLYYAATNIIPVAIGSILVTYVEVLFFFSSRE